MSIDELIDSAWKLPLEKREEAVNRLIRMTYCFGEFHTNLGQSTTIFVSRIEIAERRVDVV